MSLQNVNRNILQAQRQGGIGQVRYEVPATIYVVGGGAGGGAGTADNGAGGGGAGRIVNTSIDIAPNLTYNVIVGNGGGSNSNGETSKLFGWDFDINTAVTMSAGGGFSGNVSDGGNSGTGSVTVGDSVTNYPSAIGGTGTGAGGGGAGNGVDGNDTTTADGAASGDGATTPIPELETGQTGIAGGGGGGADIGGTGGTGKSGGGSGGFDSGGPDENGDNAIDWGAGGGGGSINGSGGSGYQGIGYIIIEGTGLDIDVTNGTLTESGSNTIIQYDTVGSGSFKLNAPYPYNPFDPNQ